MSNVIQAGDIVVNTEVFVNLGNDSPIGCISENTRLLVLKGLDAKTMLQVEIA